jgi:hypothetical protein
VNSVEGAMKKCPICNSGSNTEQIPYCRKCCWPTGIEAAMPNHSELYQAILTWASQAYKENTQLKNSNDSSASVMNVQLQNSPDLELLKLELASLNSRIRIVEDNYSQGSIESDYISDKSKIFGNIQTIEKAIRGTSSFLEQQRLHNQELDDYKQSSEKALGEHHRALQNLIKEQNRQNAEISILKSSSTGRRINQVPDANAVPIEIGNAMVVASSVGMSSSIREEPDLWKEYNSNPQEVPKSLRDGSKNVSIDDETFNRLRNGDESNIAFKPDRKGNYLVITRGGFRYLVPNRQRRIITQIYTVTKAVYKCDGYSESYKDFRLIKPALVTEESIDCWKLSQQGTLEFI